MGSFSFSFLDEKTSEALLCLQKAVSLFLAAATSEVEESSCLLYAAGSSSIVFKDFKVPETEVQQCYDTSSRKTRWQIFRSTFFVLCNAGKPKNLQKPKPYCSSANKMHSLLSYSSQNVIWSAWSKSVPKSSNLLVKKPWHYIKCHLFLFFFFFFTNLRKHLIFLISWICWLSMNVGKCVYTQIDYVPQHAFLCHVFYADLSPSLSSIFGFRVLTLS